MSVPVVGPRSRHDPQYNLETQNQYRPGLHRQSALLGLVRIPPPALKRADSIVLDEPGKASYDSASSFRVIVLIQTFSKILERIMNRRLSCVA